MIRSLPVIAMLGLALSACAQHQPPQVRGAAFYAKYCTSCHGTSAQGDGPIAASFRVPPANLTLISERNGGVFPIEDVMAQINGYEGRHQFGGMPEFQKDLNGPVVDYVAASGEVIKTPKALIDMASYLENIQRD
ncbi:c-type cytochrome [Sulfitobacter sp.]|uniref:c-type cytochrome n=1 Tax=Sulfitobacter sp. TaxID=1903071 RepID=UPI003001168A